MDIAELSDRILKGERRALARAITLVESGREDHREKAAALLKALGSQHVLVVAAEDGLDEISIAAPTTVGELKDGQISQYSVSPEQLGVQQHADFSSLQIDSAEASLALLKQALAGEHQAAMDIVALNAGAAIYVSGLAATLEDGVCKAQVLLKNGSALAKLDELVRYTSQFGS